VSETPGKSLKPILDLECCPTAGNVKKIKSVEISFVASVIVIKITDNSLIGAEMFRFGVQKGWICDSEYTVIFLSKLLFIVHKKC
jgi:hypothetical protein